MENILLTGSKGFLGKIIYNELAKQMNVKELSRKPEADIVADLANEVPLIPFDVDYVIHCAGKAHMIPRTKADEEDFYAVNLQGTKNLCAAFETLVYKPKSFVFISTVAVYGIDKGEMISEEHMLSGKSPYAASKIAAEKWLAEWCVKHGVLLTILRLPLIVGKNPPGNLGAMIRGIKTGKYLTIGKAEARKSMVWAADVAAFIPNLFDKQGVYNLTDGYHPSFGQLEQSLSKALHKPKPISIPMWIARLLGFVGDLIGSRSPIDSNKIDKIISHLTFDDSKARKLLGWKPNRVLDKIHEII